MKLCLIGSTRFKQLYATYNEHLTLAGHVVYSVAMASSQVATDGPTAQQKTILDLVHLLKIHASDAVVVVTDDERYIGESTKRELMWADLIGRKVYWGVTEVPPLDNAWYFRS